MSIIRNTIFAVTGIGVIILYAISARCKWFLTRMVAAIRFHVGLLYSGNVGSAKRNRRLDCYDSKDMRLYVDYSDGTPAFVLKR